MGWIEVMVKCSSGCGKTGWSVPGTEPPRYTCHHCQTLDSKTKEPEAPFCSRGCGRQLQWGSTGGRSGDKWVCYDCLNGRVTHLCDVDVRNRPEEQPTLCGIREPVGSWNRPGQTDFRAKSICPQCVEAFQETKTKGQNVQHIIARPNDAVALCGMSRDKIVQSGGNICPDCSAMDKLIQESIRLVRDPIHGAQMKRVVNAFSELPKTPEEAKKYLEDHPLMRPFSPDEIKVIENALAENERMKLTTKETPKTMDYKSSAVKALKRGAAAGTMKVVSKKVKSKLTEKFPALAMVPNELWNVVLCLAINMVASSSPDIPGIRMAEQLSSEAFEGLLTDATSKMVQDVIETVSETILELAEDRKTKGLLSCEE